MKFPRHPTNQNLAVFPASLLRDSQCRRILDSQATPHGYLLVSTLDNPKQAMLLLRLGHSLKQRGQQVSVLSI